VPVAAAAGLQFGFLLGGAVVTEMVFSRPGIGRLLLGAILAQDLPVVQGVVALGALGYALANGLADVAQRVLDPRLRAG
jgi:ABC-type dipeptide/oligopeptide/nickel transport system permease component